MNGEDHAVFLYPWEVRSSTLRIGGWLSPIPNQCSEENRTSCPWQQWHTQEFCWGGVQEIQLRTEDREQGSGFQEAAVIWYKKFHFI